jgi:hypothetical protein
MDTSSFDNKMAELRAEETRKAAGRPKGPETAQFRLQVKAAHLEGIKNWFKVKYGYDQPDEYWERAAGVVPEADKPQTHADGAKGEVEDLKAQMKLLLDDNDRLSKEVATLEHRLSRVARLTEDEKLRLWIRKYDELKKAYDLRVGGSEFSQ